MIFEEVLNKVNNMRLYFGTQETKQIDFRLKNLHKLKSAIEQYQTRIADALWKDLHKSFEEAYLTEFSLVDQEIKHHLKHLKQWSQPKSVPTPLHLLPSSSKIMYEPLGVGLIIAPWNYPFQLLINPLVGAIAAGCCAVLKPSPDCPNLSAIVEEMIRTTFPDNYITVIEGGRETNEILLKLQFDCIFFTGSSAVGKVVMKAAAEYLTPVILELGGKSPCIVDEEANLDIAAKRIVWGKTINAGQTCIAPDYLFVHETVKETLIAKMKAAIDSMYGNDEQQSKFYARIVTDKAFERITEFLKEGKIRVGGKTDRADKYIQPTIIDGITTDARIMKEEIFGPILPVFTFTELEEVTTYINAQPKPLALYYFGNKKKGEEVLAKTSSGGGCINDTLLYIGNHHLPFGGTGNSGIGKYHGKNSFLAFSNQRGIVVSSTLIDLPFKYAPFKFFNWIKRII